MKYNIEKVYHQLPYLQKEGLDPMGNPFVEQDPLLRELNI